MKNFRDLSKEEKNCISSKIAFNIAKESEANEFYFELKNKLATEDAKIIDEIIQDEINHLIILEKLQAKYSSIDPSEFLPFVYLNRKEN